MPPPPTRSRRRPGARQRPASRAHCSGRSPVPRLVAQRPSIVLPHAPLLLLHLLGQFPPETLQPFYDCSSCRRRLALDHSWDVSVGMAGGESSRPPTGLNGGECEPEITRVSGSLKVLPGTAPLFAAFRRAGWKAAPAHLLEPRARLRVLRPQRRLDPVKEPFEPADQLCLREANLGFARRAVERQGERLELLL